MTLEFRPQIVFEMDLIRNVVQHRWFVGRALFYQENAFSEEGSYLEKRLALFLRYQSLHERAYHRKAKRSKP